MLFQGHDLSASIQEKLALYTVNPSPRPRPRSYQSRVALKLQYLQVKLMGSVTIDDISAIT